LPSDEPDLEVLVGVARDYASEIAETMTSIVHSSNWTASRIHHMLETRRDVSQIAVSSRSGRLVGYAFAYVIEDFNECMYPGVTRVLRRLYVEPPRRGAGLGSRLMTRLTEASPHPITWQTSSEAALVLEWFSSRGISPVGQITHGRRTDLIYRVSAPQDRPDE
jgi:GNAT superfamily N-acetyltransferase